MVSRKAVILAGACMLGFPGVAFAQETAGPSAAQAADTAPADAASSSEGLEEIVVTAQKRSESLQKVPVAVAAFSGEALTEQAVSSLADLGPRIPGLKLDAGNGLTLPFLRGVGSNITAVGNESSVAVYIDGVYYSRVIPGFFSLSNIQRVEVLKGPQGTLFGRNATGGVVQVITPLPKHDTSVRLHAGYGSYDTLNGDLYATGGLSDTLAIDLAVAGTRQGDGYGRNRATGNRAYYEDNLSARSKLLFTPTEATELVLSGFYLYGKTSGATTTYPGTTAGYSSAPFDMQPTLGFFEQNVDIDTYSRAEQFGGSLTGQQDIGFAKLKSITAYFKLSQFQDFDLDKSPRPDSDATLVVGVRQFTQELQLTSLPESQLKWILGFFYYDTTSEYDPITFTGPAIFPGDVIGDPILNGRRIYGRQKVKSYSFYGQATYEVLPKLNLTGGLRYTHEKSNVVGRIAAVTAGAESTVASSSGSVSEGKLTFKAALDYQFTPDILGYASFSRGFKSGGFNLAPVNLNPVRPETIDAYEIGLKTELFSRRLRLNLSAFHYDIGSPQVQLREAAAIRTANAGSARVDGVELDGAIAPVKGLTIGFGAAYLDSKYSSFLNAPVGFPNPNPPYGSTNPLSSIDASGNRTPFATKYSANVSATYEFGSAIGQWVLSANYSYSDGYHFEPSNLFRQSPYSLVNGQIMLRPSDQISIALWGKNLTDKRYVSYQSTQAGPAAFPFTPAPPRTYGVTLGVDF